MFCCCCCYCHFLGYKKQTLKKIASKYKALFALNDRLNLRLSSCEMKAYSKPPYNGGVILLCDT